MRRTIALTVGLVVAALLGLADLASLAGPVDGPPLAVKIIGTVLGLGTLVGVVLAWPNRSRVGAVMIVVTRLLSVLTAVPAFFVDGTATEAKGAAAIGIVVTVVCVALVAPALRTRPQPAVS